MRPLGIHSSRVPHQWSGHLATQCCSGPTSNVTDGDFCTSLVFPVLPQKEQCQEGTKWCNLFLEDHDLKQAEYTDSCPRAPHRIPCRRQDAAWIVSKMEPHPTDGPPPRCSDVTSRATSQCQPHVGLNALKSLFCPMVMNCAAAIAGQGPFAEGWSAHCDQT